jgi:hypothetical protein
MIRSLSGRPASATLLAACVLGLGLTADRASAQGSGTIDFSQISTDLPCPVGTYLLSSLARPTLIKWNPGAGVGINLVTVKDKLNLCLPAEDQARRDDYVESLVPLFGTAAEVKLIWTYAEVVEILLETESFEKLAAASIAMNGCSDLHTSLERISQAIKRGFTGAMYSAARTAGSAGASSIKLRTSFIRLDEFRGVPVPPSDRVEIWRSTIAVSHAVRDRLDVGVLVPYLSFDSPTGAAADVRGSGIGDITYSARFQTHEGRRSALAIDASVTQPVGDEDDYRGTGHWVERLGLAWETVLGDEAPLLMPHAAVSVFGSEGKTGYQTDLGVVANLSREGLTIAAGANGVFRDEDETEFDDDVTGYVGIGFSSHGRSRFRSQLVDVMLTYEKTLTSDSVRAANGFLSLSVGIEFGRPHP